MHILRVSFQSSSKSLFSHHNQEINGFILELGKNTFRNKIWTNEILNNNLHSSICVRGGEGK